MNTTEAPRIDSWRDKAKELNLDFKNFSGNGFTDAGKLNIMNNMGTYLPIDESAPRDVISLIMEMAFSARAYEIRNGYHGKYLQPWLAKAIDSFS